jgi:hypothetical protein
VAGIVLYRLHSPVLVAARHYLVIGYLVRVRIMNRGNVGINSLDAYYLWQTSKQQGTGFKRWCELSGVVIDDRVKPRGLMFHDPTPKMRMAGRDALNTFEAYHRGRWFMKTDLCATIYAAMVEASIDEV